MDKQQILKDFSEWIDTIDDVHTDDSPRQEINEPDLFTLLSEFTALKEEIHRQSRVTQKLVDQYHNHPPTAATDQTASQCSGFQGQTELLMTLTDCLVRCIKNINLAPPAKRFAFFRKDTQTRKTLETTTASLGLMLDMIDDNLQSTGITRVDVEGTPFDPSLMIGIGTEATKDQDGVVLRSTGSTYLHGNSVMRHAQVIVGKVE